MKISVVLPVYNVEKYLEQCLDSIINQTVNNYEIIAINDGSTDNSLEILKKYENRIGNFKIINKNNEGLSVARNVGLSNSTGKYVLFLDSDDMLRKDAIEKITQVAIDYDVDLITFDAFRFDDEGEKQYSRIPERKGIFKNKVMSSEEFIKACRKKCLLMSTLHCYKRTILINNKIDFIKGLLHEDEYHSLTSYRYIKNVAYIEEQLYIRRFRANSIMTNNIYKNNKSLESYEIILKKLNCDILGGGYTVELKNLIKQRSCLIASNLIRYNNMTISKLKDLARDNNIRINWIRVIGNIIIFKFF